MVTTGPAASKIEPMSLPIISIAPLLRRDRAASVETAAQIAAAGGALGFFYATDHGVTEAILERLQKEARAFFDLPEAEKQQIAMSRGGAAWRGWFPLRGELTSGRPDNKEGLYLGEEHAADDPRVLDTWPLHGSNLWPAAVPGLQPAVAAYFEAATRAAEAIMQGVSLGLGLDADHFARAYLRRPTRLFRIFKYPPTPQSGWGVAEHTDYGLLTLLAQNAIGGLEVKGPAGWIAAPPRPGTLVCNVGDMLERLTGGRFVSAPHRVVNRSAEPRLSFPFFYDPDFEAVMTPACAAPADRPGRDRWDGADVHAVTGTYRDYLVGKVARVFPGLGAEVLSD